MGYVESKDTILIRGIRACRPIPKGMFVCRYVGEIITEEEAERRGAEYDQKVPATVRFPPSNERELPTSLISIFSGTTMQMRMG
jgi:SET domain